MTLTVTVIGRRLDIDHTVQSTALRHNGPSVVVEPARSVLVAVMTVLGLDGAVTMTSVFWWTSARCCRKFAHCVHVGQKAEATLIGLLVMSLKWYNLFDFSHMSSISSSWIHSVNFIFISAANKVAPPVNEKHSNTLQHLPHFLDHPVEWKNIIQMSYKRHSRNYAAASFRAFLFQYEMHIF